MAHPSLSVPIDVYDVDPIGTRPDLTIAADHMPHIFSPGKRMTYTVTYGNKSQHMDAKDVIITTILPTNTAYVDVGYDWDTSDGQTYVYSAGSLPPGSTGHTITFVVTYTAQPEIGVREFNTPFTIAEDRGVGWDTNPGDNTDYVYIGVPDLVVTDFTVEPLPLKPNVPVTFTVTVSNTGTGWALNPDVEAGFWVDVFTAPVASAPYERYSEKGIWNGFNPVPPGTEDAVVITLTRTYTGLPTGLIQFSEQEILRIREFYVKVDNHEDHPYGLVPESNEWNNLRVLRLPRVHLPLVLREDAD
jgi:uncharacterized repeat protein (TIGR01451 family)